MLSVGRERGDILKNVRNKFPDDFIASRLIKGGYMGYKWPNVWILDVKGMCDADVFRGKVYRVFEYCRYKGPNVIQKIEIVNF